MFPGDQGVRQQNFQQAPTALRTQAEGSPGLQRRADGFPVFTSDNPFHVVTTELVEAHLDDDPLDKRYNR